MKTGIVWIVRLVKDWELAAGNQSQNHQMTYWSVPAGNIVMYVYNILRYTEIGKGRVMYVYNILRYTEIGKRRVMYVYNILR